MKTGGMEKHDILGNLVNSCLVSFHFLKNHNLKKKLQAVLANSIHPRMATGANEINYSFSQRVFPRSLEVG